MNMIEFLYQRKTKPCIQMVLSNKETNETVWSPGKKCKTFFSEKNCFVGFTGRVYGSYQISMQDQEYEQVWVGIDIDKKDNQEIDLISLVPEILSEASIRTSRSGKGIHALFRLSTPYLVHPGQSISGKIKETLRPFRERLKEHEILPCKACSLNFYLLGGLNEWVRLSDEFIALSEEKKEVIRGIREGSSTFSCTPGQFLLSDFSEVGRDFFNILVEKNIIQRSELISSHYNIYIKDIYEALKDTIFSFQTSSSMSPEKGWHTNGFLSVSTRQASLFACADGKFVLTVRLGE